MDASFSTKIVSGLEGTQTDPWPEARRRTAVLAGLLGTVPNDLGVDGAADTVHQLGVNLGRHVVVVHRRFV